MTTASGAVVLDAHDEDGQGSMPTGSETAEESASARLFTAQHDGQVDHVDLCGRRQNDTAPLHVRIMEAPGGIPGGATVMDETIPAGTIPPGPSNAWYSVRASTVGRLSAGTTYALVVSATSGTAYEFPRWGANQNQPIQQLSRFRGIWLPQIMNGAFRIWVETEVRQR
jgi:hypothetical protein